ncbi:GNAT family N-acetyltransferase [Nisaea sediminum]|uniref:GNAT family N-acetyltransferase n=1 Tax=Nisaea sediminum TaxID=2775867 RepID=UPI001866F80B|nr:GNAT family N-acetyltransferase [Nisaea sediminum]
MAKVQVVHVEERHKADWRRLFDGYGDACKLPVTDDTAEAVWGWLMDPAHVLLGLIAVDGSGRAIGLAHVRAMPRPLSGSECGFLDDIFVAPEARGQGVFEALFAAMDKIAEEKGWQSVRWQTREANYRGRSAYDRVADKMPFVLYKRDMA